MAKEIEEQFWDAVLNGNDDGYQSEEVEWPEEPPVDAQLMIRLLKQRLRDRERRGEVPTLRLAASSKVTNADVGGGLVAHLLWVAHFEGRSMRLIRDLNDSVAILSPASQNPVTIEIGDRSFPCVVQGEKLVAVGMSAKWLSDFISSAIRSGEDPLIKFQGTV